MLCEIFERVKASYKIKHKISKLFYKRKNKNEKKGMKNK